jgi:hypothetical protein
LVLCAATCVGTFFFHKFAHPWLTPVVVKKKEEKEEKDEEEQEEEEEEDEKKDKKKDKKKKKKKKKKEEEEKEEEEGGERPIHQLNARRCARHMPAPTAELSVLHNLQSTVHVHSGRLPTCRVAISSSSPLTHWHPKRARVAS